MKWVSDKALWKDPIGWSKSFGETKRRVWVSVLLHIFLTILGVFLNQNVSAFAGLSSIALAGIGFPLLYLIALYHLTKHIKEKESGEVSKDKPRVANSRVIG
ncbi:MAG: hypothetical protein GY854_15035 [Deltaproteobacteria bacterium]|nr:hypothetical protein [Deltaproteobacteria bacterium]